jgi:MMPL family
MHLIEIATALLVLTILLVIYRRPVTVLLPLISRTVILADTFAGHSSVYSWSGRTETFFRSPGTWALLIRSGWNCAGITLPSRMATASRCGRL